MRALNLVQLIGHLGGDPESQSKDGLGVTKFSVATSESWLDKASGERRMTSEWHRVVCFSQLAELTKKHLTKGSKVYVSGKLKTSKWQDKHNETRYTTEVIADDLIMLDPKPAGENEVNLTAASTESGFIA